MGARCCVGYIAPDCRPGIEHVCFFSFAATETKTGNQSPAFGLLAHGWPAGATALYLDGSNMLYVTEAIREAAIETHRKHHDLSAAEDMLTTVVTKFTEVGNIAM